MKRPEPLARTPARRSRVSLVDHLTRISPLLSVVLRLSIRSVHKLLIPLKGHTHDKDPLIVPAAQAEAARPSSGPSPYYGKPGPWS